MFSANAATQENGATCYFFSAGNTLSKPQMVATRGPVIAEPLRPWLGADDFPPLGEPFHFVSEPHAAAVGIPAIEAAQTKSSASPRRQFVLRPV